MTTMIVTTLILILIMITTMIIDPAWGGEAASLSRREERAFGSLLCIALSEMFVFYASPPRFSEVIAILESYFLFTASG